MHPTNALLPTASHVQFCCRAHHPGPVLVHAAPHASRTKHQPHLRYWLDKNSQSCRYQRVQGGHVRIQSSVVMAMAQAHETPPAEANPEVVVVTTVGCQFCKRAKDTLKQAGLEYVEIDASSQQELLRLIKETTGRRSVPQIFLGGQLIGGSDDLSQLIASHQLPNLLHEAQGKPALPEDLRNVMDKASGTDDVDLNAAFIPTSVSKVEYTRLQELAAEMQSSQSHIQWADAHLRRITAAEALQWLTQHLDIQQQQAKEKLVQLQQTHQISTVGEETDLRNSLSEADLSRLQLQLVNGAPAPKFGQPLNMHYTWFGPARSPSEVSESLRQIILHLYDKHLAADGKALNYDALAQDPVFKTYVNATAELQKVDVTALSREERMAFFINIYNAVVVHALVVFGPASNLRQRLSFFNSIKYNIGGQDYSANDMEHGVLRGNRPTPASPWVLLGLANWSSGYFKPSDPRVAHVVSPVDPRIHFALVCGAKSCPPIKVYTPTTLQEGLDAATAAFCEGEVIVHKQEHMIEVSKIFKWYKQDLGPQEQLFPWLVQYLSGSSKADLQELLDTVGPNHIHVKYRHYDWALNTQD